MPRNRKIIASPGRKNQPIETKSKVTEMIEFGNKNFKSTITNMFSVLKDLKEEHKLKERSKRYILKKEPNVWNENSTG